jgi:hypothetical protein
VPDHRQHRGPHPEDLQLFAPCHWPRLLAAVEQLSWLLTRGYALPSSLKLVGDRYQLCARQRLAVQRSSCADQALRDRRERHVADKDVANMSLAIDAFNLITTAEAAMSRGILLRGRDSCIRDMASMHGSYRKVSETEPALRLIAKLLATLRPSRCCWVLDRPVSNSGRLRQLIEHLADELRAPWSCQLVQDADRILQKTEDTVVSADSGVLDQCGAWFNLAALVADQCRSSAMLVPLDGHRVAAAAARWTGNTDQPLPA